MIYAFICRRCGDLPVATCCRVMGVSTSGFYAWRASPVSDRDWGDAVLTNTISDIHRASRRSYGSPRVYAELRLGQGVRCARKRVERLMRQAGIAGIHRRKNRGCTRRDPAADPADDLVNRCFDPTEPDRLWMMDVTEHPTAEGKVYVAVVLDGFSRMVVGWSIADHIRAELVVDALQMAAWRRRPAPNQTVAHSDHGSQYTSWAFGRRLRAAGLLGSMGSVGDCFDNSVVESFFGTLQVELLDQDHCRPASSSPWPSSSGSRPGTTLVDATRTARCSAPPSTRPPTGPDASNRPHDQRSVENRPLSGSYRALDRKGWYQPPGDSDPQPRPSSHTRPVRWTGGCSLGSPEALPALLRLKEEGWQTGEAPPAVLDEASRHARSEVRGSDGIGYPSWSATSRSRVIDCSSAGARHQPRKKDC
jgi:putative transposase